MLSSVVTVCWPATCLQSFPNRRPARLRVLQRQPFLYYFVDRDAQSTMARGEWRWRYDASAQGPDKNRATVVTPEISQRPEPYQYNVFWMHCFRVVSFHFSSFIQ